MFAAKEVKWGYDSSSPVLGEIASRNEAASSRMRNGDVGVGVSIPNHSSYFCSKLKVQR